MEGDIRYKVNDVVLYATHGVCEISEITEMDVRGTHCTYYALKPLYYNNKCTIFVPVNSETLTEKMRQLLSIEEIHSLIKAMPGKNTIWIEDETLRNKSYEKILDGGDRSELVKLIKTLHFHRQSQKGKNKSLRDTDKRFMKDAERMLYEEFAHVLKIESKQVLPFIIEQIEAEGKHEKNLMSRI
jgi:CarD family transcriptional regulator